MVEDKHLAARPEDVGVDSERLDAVFARAKRDVDEGVRPSAQVAVARQGKLAGVRTFGTAVQGGVERAATDQTLYCIFSATKAVVGVAVWALLGAGVLPPRWRLPGEPASRFEYHATSAPWVLAEIIERRTGADYRAFIRDRITGRMGLDELFAGLPPEHQRRGAAAGH